MNWTTSECEQPSLVKAPPGRFTNIFWVVVIDLAALILPNLILMLFFFGFSLAWLFIGLIAPVFVPIRLLGISTTSPSVGSTIAQVAALVVFFVLAVAAHVHLPRGLKWLVPAFLFAVSLIQLLILLDQSV